ncbi:MAG: flagellar basal body P-ring formation chaperone FlgA [Burkholderiaceae bacterium]
MATVAASAAFALTLTALLPAPASAASAPARPAPAASPAPTASPTNTTAATVTTGTASAAPAEDALAAASADLQRWVEQAASGTWTLGGTAGNDGNAPPALRVEVTLGQSARLRLPACARVEPYLPANARLWGKSYIGVRCVEGANWSTLLPITVSVFGPALVATVPMPFNSVPDLANFRVDEVDWTAPGGVPVADPSLLNGRTIGRPLAAGQVLRPSDLRIPQTFSAGDPVRVRLLGRGFSISAGGFAMNGAGEGQTLRVRTETGKMVVGVVRERTVEVKL